MSAESVTLIQRLRWIVNVLFHQVVAVITVYILVVVFQNHEPNLLGTWHMILTPLGFLLLMTESLILFMKENIYTIYMKRNTKHYIHSALQVASTVLITVGIAFKISSKEGSHFTSTHGILGLVAWILVWCSVLLGIATSQASTLKNFLRPVWLKLIHILVGIAGFTFGFLSLGFGMKKSFFQGYSSEGTVLAAIIAMAIIYVWALIDTFKSLYNQIRNILGK